MRVAVAVRHPVLHDRCHGSQYDETGENARKTVEERGGTWQGRIGPSFGLTDTSICLMPGVTNLRHI